MRLGHEFAAVRDRDHVVGFGMDDDRAGLHGRCGSPFLPCRAKQNQRGPLGVDIHGDCTAARRADHHIGVVLVDLGLAIRTDSAKSSSGRAGLITV